MKIPTHIDWLLWRVVRAGWAQPYEIRAKWTISDLLDAHEILDLEEQLNAGIARNIR